MATKKKCIPQGAGSAISKKKEPIAKETDYNKSRPSWRLSCFDSEGPWGIANFSNFTFRYSQNLLEFVADRNLEEVYEILSELDGKKFKSLSDFWSNFVGHKCNELSKDLIALIESITSQNAFMTKIFPKLRSFESITWEEIQRQTHRKKDKMVSNNHEVEIANLCDSARERLKILKLDDRDTIYSLRLEGEIRIYGFREQNYLNIVWVDFNHEVYPVNR